MVKYQEYNQEQNFFIAIDKDINFPEGSFVRFINDFVDKHIDINNFQEKRKNDKIGAPAKHAKMMLKVIFYGLSQGIYSMRMIASKYIPYHLDFIYLSGYQTVDHSTLSRFINLYRKEIIEIFTRTLYISHNMEYVTKELVAIDGCKIKANASKKFTGSYKTFQKRKETYKKMIKNLMERMERMNAREIKGEITKREVKKEKERIKRLKNSYNYALRRVEEFIEESNEDESKKKGQVNLIDRDSGLMEKDNKYFQGYNCQVAANDYGLIIHNDVTGKASDRGLTEDVVKETINKLKETGIEEKIIEGYNFLLDKGYHNSESIGNIMREGYKVLIPFHENKGIEVSSKVLSNHCKISKKGKVCNIECPGGLKARREKAIKDRDNYFYKFFFYKGQCQGCKYYEKCSGLVKNAKKFSIKKEIFDNLKELNELRNKMKDKDKKDKYNKRMGIVEPVFGTIANRGFKTFLVRGKEKVKCQWSMLSTAFNLRRLFSLQNE